METLNTCDKCDTVELSTELYWESEWTTDWDNKESVAINNLLSKHNYTSVCGDCLEDLKEEV